MKIIKICNQCGVRYEVIPSRCNRSKFCGKVCRYRAARIEARTPYVYRKVLYIPVLYSDYAMVDIIDRDVETHSWYDSNGYAMTRYANGLKVMHRIILSRHLDRCLASNEFTDHINGNRLDNRRCNLRLATRRENNTNKLKRAGSYSRYKGVFSTASGTWAVQITLDGKTYCAGTFADEDYAGNVYDQWATQLHDQFARLNFQYD